jgi:hypothetical protein
MKIVVYTLSIVLLFAILRTVLLGRKIRRIYQIRGPKLQFAPVSQHQWSAWACLIITTTIVFLIEGLMTIRYGIHTRPYLAGFTEHLWGFAVPFYILLITCVVFVTGKRSPRWHRVFVYACAAWSIPMVITGDILVSHLH